MHPSPYARYSIWEKVQTKLLHKSTTENTFTSRATLVVSNPTVGHTAGNGR